MATTVSKICFETDLKSFFFNSHLLTFLNFGFLNLIIFTWNGTNWLVDLYRKLFFKNEEDDEPQLLFDNDTTSEIIEHLEAL